MKGAARFDLAAPNARQGIIARYYLARTPTSDKSAKFVPFVRLPLFPLSLAMNFIYENGIPFFLASLVYEFLHGKSTRQGRNSIKVEFVPT